MDFLRKNCQQTTKWDLGFSWRNDDDGPDSL